jgi:hypothetical protein
MANEQLNVLDRLFELTQAEDALAERFNGWYDFIPDDIPGSTQFPMLAIDWAGDEQEPAALGGYRKVGSDYYIMIATDQWDKREARRELVELSGLVTDFLSRKSVMSQAGYWDCARLKKGGQNVRVGRSDSSDRDTGYVYTALIIWQADFRKDKVE